MTLITPTKHKLLLPHALLPHNLNIGHLTLTFINSNHGMGSNSAQYTIRCYTLTFYAKIGDPSECQNSYLYYCFYRIPYMNLQNMCNQYYCLYLIPNINLQNMCYLVCFDIYIIVYIVSTKYVLSCLSYLIPYSCIEPLT